MASLTAVLLLASVLPAGAHPHVARWWQYDLETWTQSWKSEPSLRHDDKQWQRENPDADNHAIRTHRKDLTDRYRQMHYHDAAGTQQGKASWFSAKHGYCTPNTSGFYAASRTLPCGTKVSVRAGDRYVIVTIEDRGPYVGGRILDLSKSAYRKLAPLGTGTVSVTATRLRG